MCSSDLLNNLCAQGAYSGVYWNDASFQELSYVTGADSAEMGQGGMRVNMVPRDGGNLFKGSVFGNYTGKGWTADNLRSNLAGDLTYNTANRLTNVGNADKIWDVNPTIGGPIAKDKVWFNYTFRHWGVNKKVADAYYDANRSPFLYAADTSRPGIDDGHIVSNAARVSWQVSSKDKVSVYHDNQRKFRNHWGIAATVPPEASAIQVTPTSFVNVSKWTRTQTSRLLLEAGVGIYDQEYTELYQPEVLGGFANKVFDLGQIRASKTYSILDNATGRIQNAWNSPADHFSLLRTFSGAASYVTGSHNLRVGAQVSNGNWRLVQQYTGDVTPVTYNNGAPVSVTLRLPYDRRNGIKADTGIYAQDRWAMGRMTWNLGLRYDWFIGETQPEQLLPSRFNNGVKFTQCSNGINDPKAGCTGRVQNWKDLSPRVGVAYDVFGDGKTAVKASFARYVNGQAIATADSGNPITVLGITDTRPWTDVDGNGSPFDTGGNLQFNELGASTTSATFGQNVSTTAIDPGTLNGWGKRGYNYEATVSGQHQILPRLSVNGGWFRRSFGNQTFTDDLRYTPASFDGPFCVTAPTNPNLPNGGGYQVCGLYDLKPELVNIAPSSLIRFSSDFGGETNIYRGFDINLDARFTGGFLRGGIQATGRTFDNCNLLKADYFAATVATAIGSSRGTEIYPDGTTYCHREYAYRPDAKLLGSYTLPGDIILSGTFQYSRGVQSGGAGPAIQAIWGATNAVIQQALGRALAGANTKVIQLMREGLDYGDQNLKQLDLKLAKRFKFDRYRLRLDVDLYNIGNSNWPYTVSTTFSTAATSTWLRPTNVLQSRMLKVGAQLEF